jgi:hypothetical protein
MLAGPDANRSLVRSVGTNLFRTFARNAFLTPRIVTSRRPNASSLPGDASCFLAPLCLRFLILLWLCMQKRDGHPPGTAEVLRMYA